MAGKRKSPGPAVKSKSKEPAYSGTIDGIKYSIVLTGTNDGYEVIDEFRKAIRKMGLAVNPSPHGNFDGPETYWCVISEKKLTAKQVRKIDEEFYKDE
jgi:hypothetical protein